MYILTSHFSGNLEIRVANFKPLKFNISLSYVFQYKSDDYLYLYIGLLAFKTDFSVHNIHLYLC